MKNKEKYKYYNDKIDHIFLDRYIVPNWFVPEDLGLKDKEVDEFKKYLSEVACSGYFNNMMENLIFEFRKQKKRSIK